MIVALEDAKYKLIAMRADLEELGSSLRIEETKERIAKLVREIDRCIESLKK